MQRIVVPGEKLTTAPVRIENTISDKNGTYACIMGYFDEDRKSLIPLEGLWQPRSGDNVIGVIEEDKGTMYLINLKAPYRGLALAKFIDVELAVGYVVTATVKQLEKGGTVMLLKPTRLNGGKIMAVSPSRIPRIIGKGNSMLKQITEGTGTTIVIGLNGIIWLRGGKIDLATMAILKIVEEAHTTGLTERIKVLLSGNKV